MKKNKKTKNKTKQIKQKTTEIDKNKLDEYTYSGILPVKYLTRLLLNTGVMLAMLAYFSLKSFAQARHSYF